MPGEKVPDRLKQLSTRGKAVVSKELERRVSAEVRGKDGPEVRSPSNKGTGRGDFQENE